MRKLYTLGHSQCRLQSRAQVGASSPFTHCTRFVFVLLLLLGGVMQGAVGQTAPQYTSGYPKVENITSNSVDVVSSLNQARKLATRPYPFADLTTFFIVKKDSDPGNVTIKNVLNSTDPTSGPLSGDITSLVINTPNSISVNNLEPSTTYVVYLVAHYYYDPTITFETTTPTRLEFTTLAAPTPPTLVAENALSPAIGATGISLSPTLSMTFNEAVVKGSGLLFLGVHPKLGGKSVYVNVDAASIDGSGKIVSVPVPDLIAGTEYYVSVSGGFVQSTSGVPFAGIDNSATWTFTTGSAPQLSALSPLNGATGVTLSPTLSMTFNEAVSLVNNKVFRLIKVNGGSVVRTLNAQEFSIDATNTIVSYPLSGLEAGVAYYVTVDAGFVQSATSGIGYEGISNSSTWQFTTTSDGSTPVLGTRQPAHQAINIGLNPTIILTFNVPVTKEGISGKMLRIFKNDGAILTRYFDVSDANVSIANNVVSIPVSGLAPNTLYYVTMEEGFVKATANGVGCATITGNNAWTFTTAPAPQLVAENPLSPANGATGVQLGVDMTVQFNKSISGVRFNTTADPKSIYIVKNVASGNVIVNTYTLKSGTTIPSALRIDAETNTLTINPASDFDLASNYSVYIQSGAIESEFGIPFAGLETANSWRFQTINPPAPIGALTTPNPLSDVSILTDIVITYDRAVWYHNGVDLVEITNGNVADLITVTDGVIGEGSGNIVNKAKYKVSISQDKLQLTIQLVPGNYFAPNGGVTVAVLPLANEFGEVQGAGELFSFTTAAYSKWISSGSNTWTESSNWDGGVPGEDARVIISGTADATFTGTLSITDLIIEKGSKLTISPDASLTVTNDFRMYSVNGDGASASLVVDGALTTEATKTFVYQGITSYDYDYYISSPVNGAQKSVVAPEGSVFEYNVLTGKYVELTNESVLSAGKGYSGYAPAGSSFAFSGTINKLGSYQFDCFRNTINYGWNLAGNPYPCSVDLASTYDKGGFATLKPHVYIRDNVTKQLYTWNFPAEVGTADGPQIPSMHAFWVQVAIDQPSGSLTISAADRMHNIKNYHKSASATPVQKPTIKLFAQNGAVKDLSVITFISGNDDAYDDYDSEKRLAMTSSVTDLYTVKEGKRLVVNSFGEYSGAKEVPIGVYATKAGTYTLGLASLAGFDQEVDLKLVDYGTSPATTHDLSSGDYSFTMIKGNVDNRFVLQVSNKVATGVEQPEAIREVTIYAFQSDVVIENKGDAVGQYTIYDLSGRAITRGEVGAFSKISVPMPVKGVVLGVVITSKGIVNQKLLIQ